MAIGAVGLIGACLIGLQGQAYMHYFGALVLLGVGWNFLYVGWHDHAYTDLFSFRAFSRAGW